MKDKNYKGQCGNCVESDYYKTIGRDIKIYCSYYKAYYYADNSCKHYRGSYVTTAVCDILGRHEYKDTLVKIRELRTKVMEKDPNYKELLERYDRIGPKIAKHILNDYKRTKDQSLAQNLYNYYIGPTVKMYEDKDYVGAIEKYSAMEDILEDCYGFKKIDYANISDARLSKTKKEVNK